MAKFRSWNEETKSFDYFKDGKYYDAKGGYYGNYISSDTCCYNLNDLFWQNAEEATKILNKTCFEGDSLSVIGKNKSYVCVLRKDNYGFHFLINLKKIYLSNIDITFVKIIGNIHERVKSSGLDRVLSETAKQLQEQDKLMIAGLS